MLGSEVHVPVMFISKSENIHQTKISVRILQGEIIKENMKTTTLYQHRIAGYVSAKSMVTC